MEKIIILKDKANFIRKEGMQVRIAADLHERLENISEETGLAKTKVLDVILRKAIEMVEVVECEV